ncbi:hypothetical protein BE25_0003 [Staphylococcus phage vB_SepM_BE25]|nr:hypothetical protein BE25_0003 [Staphylococcus phage vB_SepM_BE25]
MFPLLTTLNILQHITVFVNTILKVFRAILHYLQKKKV